MSGEVKWLLGESNLAQGNYLLGIRPDKMTVIEASKNAEIYWRARVELVETTGGSRIIHCETGSYKFLLSVDRSYKIEEGQEIDVGFNFSDAFLFDANTERRVYSNGDAARQVA
ncbi:TOBE domain-containing protein [Vibrio variabilis]|uniref:TOBE domain-containing protein n=1 Tax=Vibrio variabilis TaxID=990271 RepID=UPI001EFA1B0E|nr:TOBE domain-containing protein [Vibrio variabilis]